MKEFSAFRESNKIICMFSKSLVVYMKLVLMRVIFFYGNIKSCELKLSRLFFLCDCASLKGSYHDESACEGLWTSTFLLKKKEAFSFFVLFFPLVYWCTIGFHLPDSH